MLSTLVDVAPGDLEIGMPVEVVFEEVTHNVTLPKFRKASRPVRASRAATNGRAAFSAADLPSTIRFEKQGRVAVITIDRPDAMNALTKDMLAGLDAAMVEFDADDGLLAAVLTATGDRAFCTGMDLKEAIPLLTSGDELGYEDHTKRQFSDVFKPIIAAVNGHCIAGGWRCSPAPTCGSPPSTPPSASASAGGASCRPAGRTSACPARSPGRWRWRCSSPVTRSTPGGRTRSGW